MSQGITLTFTRAELKEVVDKAQALYDEVWEKYGPQIEAVRTGHREAIFAKEDWFRRGIELEYSPVHSFDTRHQQLSSLRTAYEACHSGTVQLQNPYIGFLSMIGSGSNPFLTSLPEAVVGKPEGAEA